MYISLFSFWLPELNKVAVKHALISSSLAVESLSNCLSLKNRWTDLDEFICRKMVYNLIRNCKLRWIYANYPTKDFFSFTSKEGDVSLIFSVVPQILKEIALDLLSSPRYASKDSFCLEMIISLTPWWVLWVALFTKRKSRLVSLKWKIGAEGRLTPSAEKLNLWNSFKIKFSKFFTTVYFFTSTQH